MSPRGLGLGTRVSRSREYRDDLDKLLDDLKKYLRLDRPEFELADQKVERFKDRWQKIVEDEEEAINMERRERLGRRRRRR